MDMDHQYNFRFSPIGLLVGSFNMSSTNASGTSSGQASGFFLSCLAGYGWFWSSFNQMLGAGLAMGLGDTTISVTNSSGQKESVSVWGAGFTVEYSLGWTF